MTVIPQRLEILNDIVLLSGAHGAFEDGVCAMEAVSYIAGEPYSDRPQCACPVIAAFVRRWNDDLGSDDRNRLLKPLVPLLVGSKSTAAIEERRARMVIDWYVREHMTAWLELAGLAEDAAALRACAAITDRKSANTAQPPLDRARERAHAAWDAASDAAWAAARDAASDAARDAASDAASDAARDAAMGAAWAAAWDAARGAARDAAWAAAMGAAMGAAWDAAWDATWAAARDAARAAARAAARGAAWGAAWGAARDAASDAASDAARDAASDAAWAKLRPTVELLQTSAVDLVRRLVDVRDGGES